MTEHAASFPYLSCMLLSPFVGLLIMLCLKNEQKFLIRAVSVVASGISLALAIFTFVAYDKTLGGLQFVEKYEWVRTFGITYFVGVEGLNAPMLLLTGIVIFTGCLTMWELENRTKEYFIWMMALVTGVFGVFMSYDMFFFFLFYEIAVVPMYILILVWGSTRKEYAAMKLTLCAALIAGLLNPVRAAGAPALAVAVNLALTFGVAVAVGFVESLVARLKLKVIPQYVLVGGVSAAVALLATAWMQGGSR